MHIRRNRLDGSICLSLARSLVSCNDFATVSSNIGNVDQFR
ncbi:hypothetical protein AHF37_00418 [Paragonimus kellicotti]|nr:hypothetical protein AHF37_00418 [Paragonimus kellicotti]